MRRRAPLATLAEVALLVRHQTAAAVGTLVDFGGMVALVERAHLAPPIATVMSAVVGGATNFMLSRAWAFRGRHQGAARGQALRYALVSCGGALLNAALLAIVLKCGAQSYVVARAGVGIVVSVAYTFPLHTRYVFRAHARPS